MRSMANLEKNWTEADARAALSAWSGSGQSLSAYSRILGVNKQRLGWWRRRLRWSPEKLVVPSLEISPSRAVTRSRNKAKPLRFAPAILRPQHRQLGTVVRLELPLGVVMELSATDSISPHWVAAVAQELGRHVR